jgi:type III pantothenate kinase
VESVCICSVADQQLTRAVSVYCDSLSSSESVIQQVDLNKLPSWFSLGSTAREQIGNDRVVAMLGAFGCGENYCVIDAGTACTIDFVSKGEHQGGYITPGLSLARNSLTLKTAQIGEITDRLYSAKLEPGRNTQQAVEHGIRLSLVSICQGALKNAPCQLDALIVTGGDSEWLAGHLPDTVIVRPNLVFEGIHRFFRGL